MDERRNVRDMPYRRRQQGMTVLERLEELELWQTIVTMLMICVVLPAGFLKRGMTAVIVIMFNQAMFMRTTVWDDHPGLDRSLSDRRIDSFTDEYLYRHMRFRKVHLLELFQSLAFPEVVILENGLTFSGEYAFLIMLYRLHYPCTLASMELIFGRDYSQISRIFSYAIDFTYENNQSKVMGNIAWYSERFSMYNDAYRVKLSELNNNPTPGTVPVQLNDLFGSLDCTANAICRPLDNDNAQFAFHNHYHHGHFIIWQAVTFPDGMVVLEGPEPGHFTDIMVWRDCALRAQLEQLMLDREAAGLPRLKLYADKIYNSGPLVTAAWSLRHGAVHAWMTVQNAMMSKIRVSVEWAFERIIGTHKYAAFSRTQMVQNSPLAKYYVVAVFLTNCKTCMCGDIDNLYFNCVSPSLADYLDQD